MIFLFALFYELHKCFQCFIQILVTSPSVVKSCVINQLLWHVGQTSSWFSYKSLSSDSFPVPLPSSNGDRFQAVTKSVTAHRLRMFIVFAQIWSGQEVDWSNYISQRQVELSGFYRNSHGRCNKWVKHSFMLTGRHEMKRHFSLTSKQAGWSLVCFCWYFYRYYNRYNIKAFPRY